MTGGPAGAGASTVERVLVLKTVPVLADLEADDIAAIAERVRAERLARGTVLVGSEDTRGIVRLVVDGEVDEHGGGSGPRRRRAPYVTGCVEVLAGRAAAPVVAATDIETLCLDDGAALWALLEESFDLTIGCLARLARASAAVRRRLIPSGGHAAPGDMTPVPEPEALVAKIAAMRRGGPLAGAPIHALGILAREGTLVRAGVERRLWSAGDDAESVVVVLAGRLRGASPAGHAFEHGPGAIVGADAALAGEPRWYDCTASRPAVLLDLPVERLVDVLEDDWRMAAHVLRTMARALAMLRVRDAAMRRGAAS